MRTQRRRKDCVQSRRRRRGRRHKDTLVRRKQHGAMRHFGQLWSLLSKRARAKQKRLYGKLQRMPSTKPSKRPLFARWPRRKWLAKMLKMLHP